MRFVYMTTMLLVQAEVVTGRPLIVVLDCLKKIYQLRLICDEEYTHFLAFDYFFFCVNDFCLPQRALSL